MATFSYTLPVVSGSENTWGATLNSNWTALGTFFGSLDSSELAILDGALISTAELNLLQGMTPQLDGLTATAAELNILDGATITTAQLNAISGLTATAAELNIMDGVTATTSELNALAGFTGSVGYRNIPAVGTKTSGYTLATGDVGKYVQVGTGGGITIPNATFSEGDVVSIFNNTTGNITITCSITTAYLAGEDADKATLTLETRGVATVLFISGTVCVVSGNVS
jgi:hypothetical protein